MNRSYQGMPAVRRVRRLRRPAYVVGSDGYGHPVTLVQRTLVTMLMLATGLACQSRQEARDSQQEETALYIYRTDEQGVVAGDCGAVVREEWEIPDPRPADLPTAAVREVLRDVQPSRRLHAPGTKPLIEYFRGVRVQGGTAILAFDEGALEYLNNAACAQAAVKSPMIRTLLDLPDIVSVEFEIEGEIFRDWDA